MGLDERHYDSKKLTVIFAIASLVLLSALGWMFLKDYAREWKDYQKQFRSIEVEKTRVKYDRASNENKSNSELEDIKTKLEDGRKNFTAQCPSSAALEKEIKEQEGKFVLVDQKYKFTKAQLDAIKYKLEHAQAHHEHGVEELKKELANLQSKTDQFSLEIEDINSNISSRKEKIDTCRKELSELEKQERKLKSQQSLLERKLKKIDPAQRGAINLLGDMVRDLPIIDLANPNFKIEQVVLKDIEDNVNFRTVPKVERCITCHLGISNPEYQNEPQPFKTHPNLELFVGKDSAHSLEEFGCTVCHGGRPRATSFVGAVHVPSSEKQKKEWIKKYNWHQIALWEDPMLPMPYVEAGCFKCHSGQTSVKGAEKLNLGLQLIEKAGCYGCHAIDKYKDWSKPGPDLTKIASKMSKDWVYKWIEDPKSFRHNTWMPAFYNLSNNSDLASIKRGEQEILAMTEFLFNQTKQFDLNKMPTADAKKGEELVASIGCLACHNIDPNPKDEKSTNLSLFRRHGPNLIGLGSKTSKEWLFTWLKNPARYHPETKMPDLRLTDQEAADIAEYLSNNKKDAFDKKGVPAVEPKILDDIVIGFLKKDLTDKQSRAKLSEMTIDQKLVYSGDKLVSHYGCFSCHKITGYENVKPVGPELTYEGNKSLHKFDFGFVHIEHSKQAWITQKIKDPRIFDHEKIKTFDEKLKMPQFNLRQEDVEAITTALLGFVDQNTVKNKRMPRTPENLSIEEGQKIVRQLNCQGCHVIEDEGGAINDTVKDWLKNFDGKSDTEIEAMYANSSAPNLRGLGQKANAQWLFEFLHSPTTQVRPWVKVRMPTYQFNGAHLNMLVKYFNALDKSDFPFTENVDTSMTLDEIAAAEKIFTSLDCMKCHVVGDTLPTGTKDTWAPNLALAKSKLRPGWIVQWIQNPQSFMPNTKMPAFLETDASGPDDILNGDEKEQIRVLRNYLLLLSEKKPPVTQAPAPVVSTDAAVTGASEVTPTGSLTEGN